MYSLCVIKYNVWTLLINALASLPSYHAYLQHQMWIQLHCLYIRREPENQAPFQPARDVPGTFLEGSLKVLASRTYRGLLGDQQKKWGRPRDIYGTQLWDVPGTKWWEVLGTSAGRLSYLSFKLNSETY